MNIMEEEFSSKFIASVVKSVQTVCHGYLDFDHSIQIQGHILVTVDNQAGKNYILNEWIQKDSGESCTMFHSGSFHAEPPLRGRKANKKIDMMNSVRSYRNPMNHHAPYYESAQLSDSSVLDDQSFDLPTTVPPLRTKLEKYVHRQKRPPGSSHTLSFSEWNPSLHTSPGMKMTLRRGGEEGWMSDPSLKNCVRSHGGVGEHHEEDHTPVSSRYFQAGAIGAERLEEQDEEESQRPVQTLSEAGAGGSSHRMPAASRGAGAMMIDNVVSLADSSSPPERWPEIKTETDDTAVLSPSVSNSFTPGTAVVHPRSPTPTGRGSMPVMQLDAGGTTVHHVEGGAAPLVEEGDGELHGLSPVTKELPIHAFPPNHPGSQELMQDAVPREDPGVDFDSTLASSSSACPKLHKVVNRLHTTKKAFKHASRSLEADLQNKRPKLSAASRSNRHKQSHPQSVRSGFSGKKGKKQTTWRLSMLLLASKDAACVPTIEEIVELERNGLGRPAKELTEGCMRCLRKQTRQQVNDFVVKSYPNIPLRGIGFTLATATKGRKFMPISDNADSCYIEHTLGHGKLYIIPHEDIPFGFQTTPALNGADEEMMCMLQLYNRNVCA